MKESRGEVEELRGVQDSLKMEESKASALKTDNEVLTSGVAYGLLSLTARSWFSLPCTQSTRKEVLKAQEEIRELKASRNKAENSLNSVQKQLGAKELVQMKTIGLLTSLSHVLLCCRTPPCYKGISGP